MITGTDLDDATAVYFGGAASSNILSDTATQITAAVPGGTLGAVDVTVTTAGGTSPTSSADQFTGIVAPAVTSLDTLAGPNAGGTDVTIYGTDLAGATTVNFGSSAGTILDDAGSYTSQSPALAAGTVHVTVATPYGTSATSTADQFTYVDRQPLWPKLLRPAGHGPHGCRNVGLLAGDSDPQGLPLTAILVTDPADTGSLSFNSDGSFDLHAQ